LRADPLEEVLSKEEASSDTVGPLLSGTWLDRKPLTKPIKKVPLPADTEALRRRIFLLQASYTLARANRPSCPWLATAAAEVWEYHLKYILGPDVLGFALLHTGATIRSEWKVLLIYEHKIRAHARLTSPSTAPWILQPPRRQLGQTRSCGTSRSSPRPQQRF
jgi:hypothetical protein